MRIFSIVRNILWAIIIFALCAVPGNKLPSNSFFSSIPHFDKLVHFGLFFILGIFISSSLKKNKTATLYTAGIVTLLIVAVYGGLIEIMQEKYFIDRSGDLFDLLADISGGICAVIIYPYAKEKKDSLLSKKPFSKYPILKNIL